MSAAIEKSQLLGNTSIIPENQLLERDDDHDEESQLLELDTSFIPENQLLERDNEGEKKERKKELLKQINRLKSLMLNTRNTRMRRQYGDELSKLRRSLNSL